MSKPFPQAYPPKLPGNANDFLKGTVLYVNGEDRGRKGIDRSGCKNNITWVGNIGKHKLYGPYVHFSGTTSGTINNSQSLDIVKPPISQFAWVYPTDSDVFGTILGKMDSAGSNYQYGLFVDTFNYRIEAYLNAFSATTPSNSLSLQKWQLIGYTWDGSKLQFYINGEKSGTEKTYSSSTLTTQPYIYVSKPSGKMYKGGIGEIWVTKDKVKPADALEMYKETAWKYGVKV